MRVLIVDDDDDLGQALCETLELHGHRARRVPNGREALDALREGAPTCLILLDLMMPVMNGWEFREEQLADSTLASIPVVLLTADLHVRDKAKELAASGYLSKPVRPVDLLQAVDRHCPGAAQKS